MSSIKVAFTPPGCAVALLSAVYKARKSLHVQAYTFSSLAIARSLVDMKTKGLEVCVILDQCNVKAKWSMLDYLVKNGVEVSIDSAHAIAHNKVCVIDGVKVCTGSYNYTVNAERHNAENLVVIDNAEVAKLYLAEWRQHRKHSAAHVATMSVQVPERK